MSVTPKTDLGAWLPAHMAACRDIAALTAAEAPEFDALWAAAQGVLAGNFIETAPEEALQRYEALLHIRPLPGEPPASRRARVLARWRGGGACSEAALRARLTLLSGREAALRWREDGVLVLCTHLEQRGQFEELRHIVETLVPCNIAVALENSVACSARAAVYFAGGAGTAQSVRIEADKEGEDG